MRAAALGANVLLGVAAPPCMGETARRGRTRAAEPVYDLCGGRGADARRLPSPWDEPDVVRLGLALRRLGRFDMSCHAGRLAFQKSVYLLQAFGVYIGYGFSWYIRGPYSARLARHGFALERIYAQIPTAGSFSDRPTRARFGRFLDFMADKKDDPARLEALASAHFVSRLHGDPGDRSIAERVLQRQPYLGMEMCRQSLGELRSEELVQMAMRGEREAAQQPGRGRRGRMQGGRAGVSGHAGPPATDECKAAYFMIADARGPYPESVDPDTVPRRVFAGQKVCRPALTEGEIETLEILADPEAVRQLRLAARDVREGRLVEWNGGSVRNVRQGLASRRGRSCSGGKKDRSATARRGIDDLTA